MAEAKPKRHSRRSLSSATKVVLVSLAADMLITLLKFAAAYTSSSSAMTSEGIHSLIDAVTELVLLYGLANSRRKATPDHQLGFGREVFFWNFVVAILIFSLGAGITFIGGVHHILHPTPLSYVSVNFVVLGVSAIVEITSLTYTIRSMGSKRGDQRLSHYLHLKRDPTSLTILFGGEAAIVGLAITAIGTALSVTRHNPVFDGAASVLISLVLSIMAFKLASESKSLLIGVPADPVAIAAIMADVARDPAVVAVNGAVTVHLAPEQLLVALSVWFQKDLTAQQLEDAISKIEDGLHSTHPEIVALFLKPQRPERYKTLHPDGAVVTSFPHHINKAPELLSKPR